MALSSTNNVRDSKVKMDNGDTALNVHVVQNDGEAIKVELGTKGISQNIYNEINSTPVGVETLIVSYTVPLNMKFDLSNATASGENIAEYIVKVNDDVVQKKRSWWSDFNQDFNFQELILSASDKVEIFVKNNGKNTVSFNATIIGGLYDE